MRFEINMNKQKFLSIFRCFKGVHIEHYKEQTEHSSKIVSLPMPAELVLHLSQNIGNQSKPIVAVGDIVLKGQVIAEADGMLSVPLHAPTSGTIKSIGDAPHPGLGKGRAITLTPDGEDKWKDGLPFKRSWENESKENLLSWICQGGIVGLGGAAFPTHVKLNPPPGTTINTLLVNGAECEPYLTSDDIVMKSYPQELVEGVRIALKITGAKVAKIGVESNKKEAIEALKKAAQGFSNIEVVSLPVKYPQGAERNVIKMLTGIDLAVGQLPFQYGLIVINSTTSYAIKKAVCDSMPLIDKIVTVAGPAIKKPANYRVLIGTTWKHILDVAELEMKSLSRLIMGGPMMGAAQSSMDASTIKATSGLLGFAQREDWLDESQQCIRCGRCVDVCCVGLKPLDYQYYYDSASFVKARDARVQNCLECGACAYICPSNRRMTDYVRLLKLKIRKIK